jgi:hypothetical protein
MRALSSLILFIGISFKVSGQGSVSDSCQLVIPSIISLDCKNGRDYQFWVKSNCKPLEYSISIYNKWGKELYTSNDIDDFWNATINESGNYYWIIKVQYLNTEKIEKTGFVQLIK